MNLNATTSLIAAQREHAKVCGDYATAVSNIPLWEAVKNYKRWGFGHGFNGDMLAIGLAHNANQPAKKHTP